MLNILRRGAQTWVAKIFFVFLIGSFGVWGISRSLVASTPDAVMTVGDEKIGTREFRMAYERQIMMASRQYGMRLTPDQARVLGVEGQVFGQLAAGAALDQLSKSMKLGLSEARLAQQISEEPAFRAPNGQFDRQVFSSTLRNAGLTEADYIKSQSKAAVRSQIVDAIADGFKAPKTMTDAMGVYRTQTRDIRYVLVSASNIDPVKPPADDVLAKWYDQHKQEYRAPEYRKFTYMKLEPADIADPAAIAEADVKADYEKNKARYLIPGTRTIQQLTFNDKASADKAAARLKSGEATFDKLVEESGRKIADVTLGNFVEAKFPDPKTAKAAFAIATEGGVSDVVEGAFAPVILRATDIKPDVQKSYDDVKDEIRKDLAVAQAADEVMNVHDRYEDLRASGTTLEEAAKQLKLKSVQVGDVDSSGKDLQGNDVKDLPEAKKLLEAVFKTESGVDALPINTSQEGYIWFDVQSVTPEHDRKLDEVHDRVVKDWTDEETHKAVGARADELLKNLKAGQKLDDLAASLKLSVEEKTGLKRTSEDATLGREAVSAAFGGPEGFATSAWTEDKSEKIVLQVTAAGVDTTTDPLADDSKQVQQLANAAGDDMLDQMVTALQTKYGVSVNQALAQQAIAR